MNLLHPQGMIHFYNTFYTLFLSSITDLSIRVLTCLQEPFRSTAKTRHCRTENRHHHIGAISVTIATVFFQNYFINIFYIQVNLYGI